MDGREYKAGKLILKPNSWPYLKLEPDKINYKYSKIKHMNNNKDNDNSLANQKEIEKEIATTPQKEAPSSINMAELARQGLKEVQKHGGEFKVRQEQKINRDGSASASQYVGINIPNKDLNIESFQEIPISEKKPQSLEEKFNSVKPENPIKVNQGAEISPQKSEKATEIPVNLGAENNSDKNGGGENTSGGND